MKVDNYHYRKPPCLREHHFTEHDWWEHEDKPLPGFGYTADEQGKSRYGVDSHACDPSGEGRVYELRHKKILVYVRLANMIKFSLCLPLVQGEEMLFIVWILYSPLCRMRTIKAHIRA